VRDRRESTYEGWKHAEEKGYQLNGVCRESTYEGWKHAEEKGYQLNGVCRESTYEGWKPWSSTR